MREKIAIHGHQRRYSARENKDGNKQELHAFLYLSVYTHDWFFSLLVVFFYSFCSVRWNRTAQELHIDVRLFTACTHGKSPLPQHHHQKQEKQRRWKDQMKNDRVHREKNCARVYWRRHTLALCLAITHWNFVEPGAYTDIATARAKTQKCTQSSSFSLFFLFRYLFGSQFCYSLHDYMWLYVNYGIHYRK